MWTKKIGYGIASAFCALLLTVNQAAANGNLFNAANTVAQVFGCGVQTIDLNSAVAGVNNLSVTLQDTDRLAVFFNGECTVGAANDFTWLDINVQVLNSAGVLVTTISPSSDDNAFCTSTGDNSIGGHWVSASTNGVSIPLAAGTYQVRVQGTLQGCVAGNQWRIDDLSTIVLVQ